MDAHMDSELDEITSIALRARRGDAAAATAFVRATQADVWRLCAHLGSVGSVATADDLTQETYARAFGALHRFEGRSSAHTWLLSIARRTCADAVRAAVRSRRHDINIGSRNTTGPQHSTDHAETVTVRALLDTLEGERRDAFVLTQLVGLSYAEAAEVCNCPVGTIRSRIARARADLVAAYGDGSARAMSGR